MAANQAPSATFGAESRRVSFVDGMILRYIGGLFDKFPEQAHVKKADGSMAVSSLVLPRSAEMMIETIETDGGDAVLTRMEVQASRDPIRPRAVSGLSVSEVMIDDYAEMHGQVWGWEAVYPPQDGMRQIHLTDVALAIRQAYKLVK